MAKREPTDNELALVGLARGDALPAGGPLLPAVYFEGSRSSKSYLSDLKKALNCPFEDGSFNLRLCSPVALTQPRTIVVDGEDWHAVPIVVNEAVLGVHAWLASRHDDTFLEIFSPVRIRDELAAVNGVRLLARPLSGAWLRGPV